jgi:hypothetical protein
MKLAHGIKLPFPNLIKKEYEVNNNTIIFNADVDDLLDVIIDFVKSLEQPIFFFIEIPVKKEVEDKLRKKDTDPFHIDVYYWDYIDNLTLTTILKRYGELLLNDGLVRFGVGSKGREEIYVRKYKVTYILSNNIEKHQEILNQYNYVRTDNLVTPYDTFSTNNPGTAYAIKVDGFNIFDLVEMLQSKGLYYAKTVKE